MPGERVGPAPGVPTALAVGDSVVDSVRIVVDVRRDDFRIAFADTTAFHVFTLPAEEDKPFRIVVDVQRPRRDAAEARAARGHRGRQEARPRAAGGDRCRATAARTPARAGRNGVLEKNVTLAVAKALVEELEQDPGRAGRC